MPLKSICNKKPGFTEKSVFLSTTEKFKQEKNLLINIIFGIEFFSPDLFRAAPYRLMVVLHKGVLFHSIDSELNITLII